MADIRFVLDRPFSEGIVEVKGEIQEDGSFIYNPAGREVSRRVIDGEMGSSLEEAQGLWEEARKVRISNLKYRVIQMEDPSFAPRVTLLEGPQ